MDKQLRIQYACRHVLNKAVATFAKDDWWQAVRSDGALTVLEEVPGPISSVEHEASVVAAVASGMCVTSPGLEIVRHDPKDAPLVYNVDNYSVYEDICTHPAYSRILEVAGVKDGPELRHELNTCVYFVKNEPQGNHWTDSIPQYIREAKDKYDL